MFNPAPKSTRFKATRCGITSLFDYGDQEFSLENGRILLRGKNGSGKSRALELIFPLALDGDMRPHALDSSGGGGKGMKYNLLGDGQYKNRIGYAWIELYLEAEDRYITAIFGARGREGREVDPWFALTELRVNLDFSLQDESGIPLDKAELKAKLGDVSDTRAEHIRKVNQALYGFESDEELKRHFNIGRAIRKPKLSEQLQPEYVSQEILNSLPELDQGLLRETQERLDDLEQMQQEKEDNQELMNALLKYQKIDSTYQRRMIFERASQVKKAERDKASASQKLTELEKQEAEISRGIEELQSKKRHIEAETERANSAKEQLLGSKEMRDAEQIAQLDNDIENAEKRIKALQEKKEAHETKATQLGEEQKYLKQKIEQASAELRAIRDESSKSAAKTGIAGHDQIAEGSLKAAQHGLKKLVAGRRYALDRRSELEQKLESAKVHRQHAEANLNQAKRTEQSAASDLNQAVEERDRLVDGFAAKLGQWIDSIKEIKVDSELRETALSQYGNPREAIEAVSVAGLGQLAEAEASLKKALDDSERAIEERKAELKELREGATPLPERPPWRTAERDDQAIALFNSCEFTERTEESERGGIEGALEAAGLLDALVLPSGSVINQQGEIGITGDPDCREINPYLQADQGASVDQKIIQAVLGAIRVVDKDAGLSEGECVVGLDGSWKLGPAQGVNKKEKADFVGAAGREASRLRRIGVLVAEIEDTEAALTITRTKLEELAERRHRFSREIKEAPNDGELLRLESRIELLEQTISAVLQDIETCTGELKKAEEVLAEQRFRLDAHDRESGLNGSTEQLRQELSEYSDLVDHLIEAMRLGGELERESEYLNDQLDGVKQNLQEAEREIEETCTRHKQMQGKREAMEAQARGIEQARSKLSKIRNMISDLKTQLREVADQLNALSARQGENRSELKAVQEKNDKAEEDLKEAVDRFRTVEPAAREYLEEEIKTADAADISLIADRPELKVKGETESLVNRLDKEYTALVGELSGAPMTAAKQQVDGVYEVRIIEAGGSERTLGQAIGRLKIEMDHAEKTLSEKHRLLFRNQMVGSIARAIGHNVADGKQMIADINNSIAKVPTSVGHTMSLELKIDPSFEAQDRRVLQLITEKDIDLLSPPEMQSVVDFMVRRVDEAREIGLSRGETVSLSEMMNYRSWLKVKLIRQDPDGSKKEYDQKTHSRSSGGEKATAILLPMMAMLAGHLNRAKPYAPRMMVMDEAFVGIDAATQRKLISLMNDFDFDCILTSCELWCCYPEMSGLSIYNLERDEQAHQIGHTQFLWNGFERIEVEALEEQLL